MGDKDRNFLWHRINHFIGRQSFMAGSVIVPIEVVVNWLISSFERVHIAFCAKSIEKVYKINPVDDILKKPLFLLIPGLFTLIGATAAYYDSSFEVYYLQ